MIEGKYKEARRSCMDLKEYQTVVFDATIIRHNLDSKLRGSCGTNALSTLTGISPQTIDRALPPGRGSWTDTLMRRYLKTKGYQLVPLTRCDLTSNPNFIEYPITRYHVLLVSQWMVRNEGSWIVVHKGRSYHNMEEEYLDPLEFINKPIMSAYIVWHPRWARHQNRLFKLLRDPVLGNLAHRAEEPRLSKHELLNQVRLYGQSKPLRPQ